MTYKRFLKVVLSLQKQDRELGKLYKLKIDLLDFVDPYHAIITELIKEIYGDEGYDWFSWFCYESEYGQKDWSSKPTMGTDGKIIPPTDGVKFGAHDEKGNPICYSIESTWEYLEANHNSK